MKYKTHNEIEIPFESSWLQGHIEVSYTNLVKAFGEPILTHSDKTDAEWEIQFEDGTIATIYNYKNGKNYLGSGGKNVHDIMWWNIGGRGIKVVDLVGKILKDKKINMSKEREKLKSFGYYTDNLWNVEDVKSLYDCEDDTAYEILSEVMESAAVMEAVWDTIKIISEERGFKIKGWKS